MHILSKKIILVTVLCVYQDAGSHWYKLLLVQDT